jgi:hypothetical protein
LRKLNNGLSTAQGSTVPAQDVLKLENFMPCDESPECGQIEETLEQTIWTRYSRIKFLNNGKI